MKLSNVKISSRISIAVFMTKQSLYNTGDDTSDLQRHCVLCSDLNKHLSKRCNFSLVSDS